MFHLTLLVMRVISYFEDVNFNARYKYGNKQKGGIKIMHWNAGGGFLKNKIHDIENVVSGYRPHLFGISETSFICLKRSRLLHH